MMYAFFFSILLYCFVFNVHADISVTPIVVDLEGKDAEAEIAVKNFDTKHNAYVEITPYRLLHPEDRSTRPQRVLHPEQEGLLVFPAKLVLLPGQTQFVRILKTAKAVASEQVYEVDFIPKVASQLVGAKLSKDVTLGIRVIVGYGARVVLRPDVTAPSFAVKRVKNELIIKNTGNTLLNITSCTQQIAHKKTEVPLPVYTLFAGQAIKKELSQATSVTVAAAFMGKPLAPFKTD